MRAWALHARTQVPAGNVVRDADGVAGPCGKNASMAPTEFAQRCRVEAGVSRSAMVTLLRRITTDLAKRWRAAGRVLAKSIQHPRILNLILTHVFLISMSGEL
jgi:hypothetical protein